MASLPRQQNLNFCGDERSAGAANPPATTPPPPASGVGGDTDEDFAYDALNRLTEAKDNDSIVQFTYDSLSRVLTEVQGDNPLASSGKTTSYTYDAEGNRTKIDYPSGFDANEARDALRRISAITDGSSATVASFDLYGPGLRKKKTTFGNTTTANFSYDGFRRPTEIAHKTSTPTTFASFEYGWDKNDNPTYEARSHQSGKGDVYSYDRANRLINVKTDCDDPAAEVASPGTEVYVKKLEYDMDDVFNLTAYKVTPYGGSTTTTSYTTNAMNEYTAIGGTSLSYTDAGSLEDDGTYEYEYDAHQHLIRVILKSNSSTVATYKYDALGLGRRIKKTVGSDVTRYVYAGQQSIEEYDGSGNLARLFVFGERIDDVLMMESSDHADVDGDSNTTETVRLTYHSQLIGSVTHVTAPNQAVVESYLYDPYGKVTMKNAGGSTIGASAIKNPYLYTGRQLDEETGLHYYRARHYSAEMRRFIQRDPLEYVDGPSALAYSTARPCGVSDPSGCSVNSERGRHLGVTLATSQQSFWSAPRTEALSIAQRTFGAMPQLLDGDLTDSDCPAVRGAGDHCLHVEKSTTCQTYYGTKYGEVIESGEQHQMAVRFVIDFIDQPRDSSSSNQVSAGLEKGGSGGSASWGDSESASGFLGGAVGDFWLGLTVQAVVLQSYEDELTDGYDNTKCCVCPRTKIVPFTGRKTGKRRAVGPPVKSIEIVGTGYSFRGDKEALEHMRMGFEKAWALLRFGKPLPRPKK